MAIESYDLSDFISVSHGNEHHATSSKRFENEHLHLSGWLRARPRSATWRLCHFSPWDGVSPCFYERQAGAFRCVTVSQTEREACLPNECAGSDQPAILSYRSTAKMNRHYSFHHSHCFTEYEEGPDRRSEVFRPPAAPLRTSQIGASRSQPGKVQAHLGTF